MQGYLSADTICSEMRTVFRGESSRKLWALKGRLCPRTNIHICEQIITLNGSYCFVSLTYFWNAGGEIFMNSLWFAVWNVYFSVFSGMTLWTNKHVSSSVTTAKLLSILNYIWNNCFYSTRRKVWKLGNISCDIPSDIFPFFLGGGGEEVYSITWWVMTIGVRANILDGLWFNLSYDR